MLQTMLSIIISCLITLISFSVYKSDIIKQKSAFLNHESLFYIKSISSGFILITLLLLISIFSPMINRLEINQILEKSSNLLPVMIGFVMITLIALLSGTNKITPGKKLILQSAAIYLSIHSDLFNNPSLDVSFEQLSSKFWISGFVSFSIMLLTINSLSFLKNSDGLVPAFLLMATTSASAIFLLHQDISFAIISSIFAGYLLAGFINNSKSENDNDKFNSRRNTLLREISTSSYGFIVGLLFIRMTNLISSQSLESGIKLQFNQIEWVQLSNYELLPYSAISLLFIPIADLLRVIFGRLIRHQLPFKPDGTHIHELLKERGFGSNTIILMLLSCQSIVIITFALLQSQTNMIKLITIILLFIIYARGIKYLSPLRKSSSTAKNYELNQLKKQIKLEIPVVERDSIISQDKSNRLSPFEKKSRQWR